MPEASVYAQVCDLLGGEPDECPLRRPTDNHERKLSGQDGHVPRPPVAEALGACPRASVAAARAGREDVAVVVLEDGRAFVVPDHCPHDGGPLSDGFVDAGRLVCARHGWEFDPESGACITRPRRRIASRRATILDPDE